MTQKKNIFYFFLTAFGIELISFLAHELPFFSLPAFISITFLFCILAWKNFPLAVTLLFLELFIGSKGHLLDADFFGFVISLRLLLFVIIFFRGFVLFIISWIHKKKFPFPLYSKNISVSMIIFFIFLLFGVIFGIIKNNPRDVFFDLNGYLYFAIFFIVSEIFSKEKNYKLLFEAFIAGILWLFAQTYFLFFIFSHGILSITPIIYRFVRDTGLAEPTRLPDSSIYRIFLQSHIFAIIGFFVFFLLALKKQKKWKWHILSSLSFTMILISYSRSFFVATVMTLMILIVLEYKNIFSLIKNFFLILSLSLILIGANIFFPVEKFLPGNAFQIGDVFSKRFDITEETGAKSRWTQIPPLFREIQKNQVFGNGFGKTITYQSADPRNREKNPEGWYTTYASEWGYLDILLKIGNLGLMAYLFFLSLIIINLFQIIKKDQSLIDIMVLLGIFSVISTNIFTPYLNHPLGIGVVLIAFSRALSYDHE